MTPPHSLRYSRNTRVKVTSQLIPSGLYTSSKDPEPQYLPQNWSTHVQPEGQRYFYNNQTRIVTEAYLFHPGTLQRIICWAQEIAAHNERNNMELPSNYELFLELGNTESDGCRYYYVDHTARTLFWLNDVTTDDLDISATASNAQLRWAFTEFYWMHMEYFPSHGISVPYTLVDELVAVLTQARADHTTSSLSTFPYTATQCASFLDLINANVRSVFDMPELRNPYYIWVVARIWSQIAHHRFTNYYGEEQARLSRVQCILESVPARNPVYMKLTAWLLFNEPVSHEKALDSIWIDEVVYAEAWKPIISRFRQSWNESITWSFGLLITHAVMLSFSGGYKPISVMAMALSADALSASIALTKYHFGDDEDAAAIAQFLYQTKHTRLGFKPLAALYSLPKALSYWSIVLLGAQISAMAFSNFNIYLMSAVLIPTALLIALLLIFARSGFSSVSEDSSMDVEPTCSHWYRGLFGSFLEKLGGASSDTNNVQLPEDLV